MKHGDPEHFSKSAEKILKGNLFPYSGIAASHPKDLPAKDTRINDAESPIAWLQRIAAKTAQPDQLIFHENIAFTAEIFWRAERAPKRITKVHAQALILYDGVTVEDFICGGKAERYQYLRADFDPENLGRVFPDPMVHVHAASKGELRFPISMSNTLPHVDFIELILRNYARDVWEDWANRVWERRIKPYLGGVEDSRAAIRSAFAGSQHKTLREGLREPVKLWKQKLIEEKRLMCPLLYESSFDEVLNY